MKNSLKQLLRTPMKTCLFFLLMTAATALLVLGAELWQNTQAKIDAAEGLFVTLGTVEQLPDYEAPVDNASAATSLAGVAGSVMTFVLAGAAGGAILAVKKRKKAAEKKE